MSSRVGRKRRREDGLETLYGNQLLMDKDLISSQAGKTIEALQGYYHSTWTRKRNAWQNHIELTVVAQNKFCLQLYENKPEHFLLSISEPMEAGPFGGMRLVTWCATGLFRGALADTLQATLQPQFPNTPLVFLRYRTEGDLVVERGINKGYGRRGNRVDEKQDALLKVLVGLFVLALRFC
jgi:hypothetical protein